MSEWKKPEWKTFAEYFLPEYNKLHDTKFLYNGRESKVINSDQDFIDPDGGILSIQHTGAVGTENDIKMEIARPRTSEKLMNGLREELTARGVNNCSIILNISNPPQSAEEAKSAIYWISELIQKKYNDSSRHKIFSFDKEEYDIYISQCIKWVSEIDIFEDDKLRISFGWSKYPIEVQGVLDSEARFINAINRKQLKKYTNADKLILLIDFSAFPFDKEDIDKFKKIVDEKGTKFMSIWVYQLWSGARGAFEIFKK